MIEDQMKSYPHPLPYLHCLWGSLIVSLYMMRGSGLDRITLALMPSFTRQPENITLHLVTACLVLNATTGERILVKYYPSGGDPEAAPTDKDTLYSNRRAQEKFEKALWQRTRKALNSILRIENCIYLFSLFS